MTAPRKLLKSVTSAHPEGVDLGEEPVAHPRPDASRDVRPRGGRALLPLVLERAPDQGRSQHVRVGARVRQHEVLAAGLPDEPRVGPVAVDVRCRPCARGGGTPRSTP